MSSRDEDGKTHRIKSFTFLRYGKELADKQNWEDFGRFVKSMHAGLDDKLYQKTATSKAVSSDRNTNLIRLPVGNLAGSRSLC